MTTVRLKPLRKLRELRPREKVELNLDQNLPATSVGRKKYAPPQQRSPGAQTFQLNQPLILQILRTEDC